MSEDRLAFTFHKCLGAGGFGEVYLASQHTTGGLKRLVAVKILREKLPDDDDAVKRLRDEGQILAMLSHPVILGVHQFTRVEGRLALVTEYVEGIDISVVCTKDNRMPLRAVIGVIGEVAAALDFAYTTHHPETGRPLKLIHRDIKPENIRITHHGQVKLLDFGIARSNEMKRQAKTAMGDVLMTPGYGAPEALAFGVTSPKVDVYALGATLYRMVTGEKLFEDRPIDFQLVLAMDTVDYGEYLEERLELVDEGPVRDLLAAMLTYAPEDRPSADQVTDLCEEMERVLDGPTVMQWARRFDFDAYQSDSNADGALEGKALTTGGHVRAVDEDRTPKRQGTPSTANPAPAPRTPSRPISHGTGKPTGRAPDSTGHIATREKRRRTPRPQSSSAHPTDGAPDSTSHIRREGTGGLQPPGRVQRSRRSSSRVRPPSVPPDANPRSAQTNTVLLVAALGGLAFLGFGLLVLAGILIALI